MVFIGTLVNSYIVGEAAVEAVVWEFFRISKSV